jgi:hypothetical protein
MATNQPKFFILGYHENIEKVLNKLPNKNKLYNNYLYDIEQPFIEYGFYLQKEDEINNSGDFRVIVCPENINQYEANLFKNDYFKDITALIICHNNNNYNYKEILNVKEIIHIWFDIKKYDINNKDLHYYFNDNNWINRIYNHLDLPFAPPNNDTNIVFDNCKIL